MSSEGSSEEIVDPVDENRTSPIGFLTVLSEPDALLPSPEFVREYNKIIAGSAERILVMGERQLANRHLLEKKELDAAIADAVASRIEARRGQWLGFAIASFTIAGGSILVGTGHDVAGATIVTSTVVGLAAVFALGRKQSVSTPKE